MNSANKRIIIGSIRTFKTRTQHQCVFKSQRDTTIAQLSYSSQCGKSCKWTEDLWCSYCHDIAYLECSMLFNSVCWFIWRMWALGKGYGWQHCKVDTFSCKVESLVRDIPFWKVLDDLVFGWAKANLSCLSIVKNLSNDYLNCSTSITLSFHKLWLTPFHLLQLAIIFNKSPCGIELGIWLLQKSSIDYTRYGKSG